MTVLQVEKGKRYMVDSTLNPKVKYVEIEDKVGSTIWYGKVHTKDGSVMWVIYHDNGECSSFPRLAITGEHTPQEEEVHYPKLGVTASPLQDRGPETPRTCSCTSLDLWNYGCKCGCIESERS